MPYVVNEGVKIYWNEEGQGEPVLLIMGLGYSSEMWHRTLPVISEQYRTIFYDNRGVGKTDAPPGPYMIPAMARDAEAVIRAAGCKRVHIFGISMGGMIAQELALNHPEMVQSLILGCTTCGGPQSVPAKLEVLAVLQARGNMTPEEGVLAMVPYIYDEATPRDRIEEDLVIRRRTFPPPESYFAQVMGIMQFNTFERLPQLKGPTLVIHGESDQLVPPENGRILAERIPGARLVMLPNASHIFPTDQPAAAHKAVLDFLRTVAGSARQ